MYASVLSVAVWHRVGSSIHLACSVCRLRVRGGLTRTRGCGGAACPQRRTRSQKYQNTFAYKHNKSSKRTLEILAVPIGGVCKRCYDVLTWRKAYRKYKPKTRPGKCNICAKKSVNQAYCSICRPCAKAKSLCEKCGCKPAEVRVCEPREHKAAVKER
eukprot:COSAG02_NODE_5182_length_4563_cov_4.094982_5_plen_158_part_00